MVNTSSARIPADMLYAPIDIPDDVTPEILDRAALPDGWFGYPPPPECQTIGDAWVSSGRTVALVVPSAVARIDCNLLLNPAHPDFTRLIIGKSDLMAIDDRLTN